MTSHDLMKLYCKETNKFAVYYAGWTTYEPSLVSTGGSEQEWSDYLKERDKACIFLDPTSDSYGQEIHDGEGYRVFNTEKEAQEFYLLIVGDDGPTKSNPYNGPIKVYALTCGPTGIMTENT